jgi:hypothetical protein
VITKRNHHLAIAAMAVLAVAVASGARAGQAGAQRIPAAAPQSATSWTDPFAYCAAVGNIDAPDERWTGDKVPGAVVDGLKKALDLAADVPAEFVARGASWRCMNARVYACSAGANIPCLEKANPSMTPNSGMTSFCSSHPVADLIPAFAAGRSTVFEWKCVGKTPTVVRQVLHADPAGFITEFWYALAPPVPSRR